MNTKVLLTVLLVPALCLVVLDLSHGQPPKFKGPTSISPHISLKSPGMALEANKLQNLKLLALKESKALKLEFDKLPNSIGKGLDKKVIIGFDCLRCFKEGLKPGPIRTGIQYAVIPIENQPHYEKIIQEGDFLPAYFLEAGAISQRAVGRIAIKYELLGYAGIATGFMVSDSLMMTNWHVMSKQEHADLLELQMNYLEDYDSKLGPPVHYEFDANDFFYTNEKLDFTLLRVKPLSTTAATGEQAKIPAGKRFGYIPLKTAFFYSEKQFINIIQHPSGRPREVVLRNNQITSVHDDLIRYTTDTESGSSGSPCFNNRWQLIALHSSAGERDGNGKYLNNQGIRMDKIIDHLRQNVKNEILKELGI